MASKRMSHRVWMKTGLWMIALLIALAGQVGAATVSGATGLIYVPSADTLGEHEAEIGVRYVDGKLFSSFMYGVFDQIEIGVNNVRRNGDDSQLGFVIKGNVFSETAERPAVAVGFETDQSYIVASKRLTPRVRGHVGFGHGDLRGAIRRRLLGAQYDVGRRRDPDDHIPRRVYAPGPNAGVRMVFSPLVSVDVSSSTSINFQLGRAAHPVLIVLLSARGPADPAKICGASEFLNVWTGWRGGTDSRWRVGVDLCHTGPGACSENGSTHMNAGREGRPDDPSLAGRARGMGVGLFRMRIVDRYTAREFAGPSLPRLAGFTVMLLSGLLFELTDLIVDRKMPIETVGRMLMYRVPSIVVLTLPIAALFGTLLSLGRLAKDSEVTVLLGTGTPFAGWRCLSCAWRRWSASQLLSSTNGSSPRAITGRRPFSARRSFTIPCRRSSRESSFAEPTVGFSTWVKSTGATGR